MKLCWKESDRIGYDPDHITIYVAKDIDGWRWKAESEWTIADNIWHGTASSTRADAIESAKREILNQSGKWANVYFPVKLVVGRLEKKS